MRLFSLLLVACTCASTLSTLHAQTNEIYTSFFGLSGSVGAFKQTFDVLTGDIIFTGYSDGSVGVPGQPPIPSIGSNDWFIARYTIGGDLIWFRTIASTGDERGFTVNTDAQGNIYVGGTSNGALTATRSGGFDPYVAKYSANGTRLWVKNIVSNVYNVNVNDNQAVFSIQVDGENLYIVTQEYSSSITVTKWDKEVTASAWKQVVQMPRYLVVTDVTLDSNHNIILSGSRSDGADIPGVEVNGITIPAAISRGGWDGFVLAFNGSSPTGARTMCANQGSSGEDQSMAVTVDSTNNIYVTGYVQGNYDDHLWRNQNNRPDVFITKYGPITEKGQGIRLWSRVLYPAGVSSTSVDRYMRGAKLQVDYVGALYMLTSEQYPTSTSGIQSDIAVASQVYIEKYDANGNTLWGQALPPAATVAHGFHLDSTGTMYISGIVTSSWGSTPLDRGSQVAFIHKRANPLNCSCNEMASLVDEVMNLAGINVV